MTDEFYPQVPEEPAEPVTPEEPAEPVPVPVQEAQPTMPPAPPTPVRPVAPAAPAPAKSHGAATASLVFGILALLCCCLPVVGLILSLIGVICGIVAVCKKQGGMGIAGLILSLIGLIAGIALCLSLLTAILHFDEFKEALMAKILEMKDSGQISEGIDELVQKIVDECLQRFESIKETLGG